MSRRRHKVKARAVRRAPRFRLVSEILAQYSLESLRAKFTELESREMQGASLSADERAELRALRQIPGVRRAYAPTAFKAIADADAKRRRRGERVLELRARGGLPPLPEPDPPTAPEAA